MKFNESEGYTGWMLKYNTDQLNVAGPTGWADQIVERSTEPRGDYGWGDGSWKMPVTVSTGLHGIWFKG